VAIVAALAAILLPWVPRATSRSRLEAYAVEVATLLKADRNAALKRHAAVAAQIDVPGRLISSGSSAHVVRVPEDVAFDALLPRSCNGRPALSTISFFGTGTSCGGVIRLTRFGTGFDVRVNWLTGGIDIVARSIL
jgi:general secretion pathway protein H